MASSSTRSSVALLLALAPLACVQILGIERLPVDDVGDGGTPGPDTQSDSATTEGSPTTDGSTTDGGDAFANADAQPCVTVPDAEVCDDFESVVLRCNRTVINLDMTAVDAEAVSPTKVLRVTASSPDGGTCSGLCRLKPSFAAPMNDWQISVFFRATAQTTDPFSVLSAQWSRAADSGLPPKAWIEVKGQTANLVFFDGLSTSLYGEVFAVKLAQWNFFSLEFDSATFTLKVVHDGVPQPQMTIPSARIGVGPVPEFDIAYWGDTVVAKTFTFDLDDFRVRRTK
jgi:hypothetical protein